MKPTRRRFIILEHRFPPREVLAEGKVLEIGRDLERGIALNNPTVSRLHAVIRRVDGDLILEDAGSTHGTLVNYRRIPGDQTVTLQDGDVLQFGEVHVVCRFEDEPMDLKAASRDAAFAAQANARVLVLEDDQVRRSPLTAAVSVIGCAPHCDVRVRPSRGPLEQAIIRARKGQYRLEPRSTSCPPLLNETQEPVVECRPLPTNAAIAVQGAQLLFLYDYDQHGRPVDDPLTRISGRRLRRHVVKQCGITHGALRELSEGRRLVGQKLGEVLVAAEVVTPLFWRVVCARLLGGQSKQRCYKLRKCEGS